jgi:predicted enzyme related to lactoylglutathione lyase
MEGRVFYMEFPSLDVDRATRFWNGVMGWNFGSGVFEQFDYRMAQIASDAAVAITPAVEQGPNVYMETPDLESALERVKELGGAAGEIRDIPGLLTAELPSAALHGRFAGCKDSEGNMFHLWQRNRKTDRSGNST